MSRLRKLVRLFTLRRISGQIAALILSTLVLIHALIAGYVLVSRPKPSLLTDEPLQQFELIVRILDKTPRNERRVLVENIGRGLPDLQLRLTEGGPRASATPTTAIPSPFDGRVQIVQRRPPEQDSVLFDLGDGEVLDATVRTPSIPGFITGLWASTLLFLVISITLLGVWAGRALSAPLSAFARAAESFSLSRSSAPLPESGPEEIRSAAKALNLMRNRITSLMNDRTRMLAAISHDLRTPITRLRLRSEYIEDDTQRTQTLRDLDQMQAMLESVLILLRGGSGARPTLVDIAALVQMVCEEFADCGHAVHYHGPSRLTLTVKPDEIRRALANLIGNAVRFGSEVNVALSVANAVTTIEISDDGPGIPDDKKAAMLEPFVRGDDARTMNETSGFGLGLSIASSIVEAHGGSLSLQDNQPHGLKVVIVLSERRCQASADE
ncbi:MULTISPECIES: ATP-binding protein [Bradyrhizobium]|uniref:histidine kinase n=1 Tax=Bradyrhizobium diazoefficiens (strain JCM 10833 / BCRC 13528 / IAM 13628 / NBRC 14792 / USDA 110) TaxID=224911 RepID=Q89NX8_BRADU|nr:ATP-binding protein [Bradyrhizobium diazoefficiens]MBP1066347.1 signal transduction histidine kinase [Bradyrhizobium japonicum]AND89045.1 histidine kinase [Bradyrhizobium diazoefficiens USDA 110]AWO90651.1 HAMP domain-containing protein [Bradyrhizobium diazoefficiens]PDT60257.1 two-component sensor histidine kinase [Bradyrhizobium diazoefficiens]QBP22478.1 HAMP domain-containing protein [Bradyrhizobium diazoefficiens]